MILPGVFAVVLYPDLPALDLAFPTPAFDLLPIGMRGPILAALISAITSTVDPILNSASTVGTIDFVRPLKPDVSDRQLVLHGRITTALVALIAVIWSPQIPNFPSLWQYSNRSCPSSPFSPAWSAGWCSSCSSKSPR